jgi:Zn-dependent M32 family carboxypeptidase
MNKKELKEEFSKDFKKVKSALLEVISTSRTIASDIAESLAQEDYTSIEEYTMLTSNILQASKNFTELYTQAPKILGSIDKDIKEEKKKINLQELIDDESSET